MSSMYCYELGKEVEFKEQENGEYICTECINNSKDKYMQGIFSTLGVTAVENRKSDCTCDLLLIKKFIKTTTAINDDGSVSKNEEDHVRPRFKATGALVIDGDRQQMPGECNNCYSRRP